MSNLISGWSAVETEYAVKHWREGKSAGEVAKLLNNAFGTQRTRNSVIGRVHRLGEGRPEPVGGRAVHNSRPQIVRRLKAVAKAKPGPKPKPKPMSPPKPLPAPVVILADVSFARPWLTRAKSGECCFPIGERGAVLSCCFPTGETYCAPHREAMGGQRKAWSPKDHRNVGRAA
jgi:hypothetical protein